MPFIEENDLFNLHKDIEKAQANNDKLLEQVKYKNRDLRKIAQQRNIFVFTTILLVAGFILTTAFDVGLIDKNMFKSSNRDQVSVDSLRAVQTKLSTLRAENDELRELNEFYADRFLIGEGTIYTVQVMAFSRNKTALASEALTNSRFVKNNRFYSYSLGNFTNLAEAQSFRKQLVRMGFRDAFVASYRDGKRVGIEDPY